jgi:hypothetical protein
VDSTVRGDMSSGSGHPASRIHLPLECGLGARKCSDEGAENVPSTAPARSESFSVSLDGPFRQDKDDTSVPTSLTLSTRSLRKRHVPSEKEQQIL